MMMKRSNYRKLVALVNRQNARTREWEPTRYAEALRLFEGRCPRHYRTDLRAVSRADLIDCLAMG